MSVFGNSRYFLFGQNGVGKTTLMKMIAGILPIDTSDGSSNYIVDPRIKIGYYNQQIVEDLPLKLSPIQFLQSIDAKLSIQDCKEILGKLGLKRMEFNDPTNTKIINLSSGQKSRVAFAKIQIGTPDLYLFDEPTNHLDMNTVDEFIDSINNFNGACIIITHNMSVIEECFNNNTKLFIVGDLKIKELRNGIESLHAYIEEINT